MPAENIFLSGPHRPSKEEFYAKDLEVIGEIPKELDGTLYRTSSNPEFFPVHPSLYHWFDGDGMIGAITLRNGKASIRTRWVETEAIKIERTLDRAVYNGLGGGPRAPLPPNAPPFKHAANTHVFAFEDKVMVFSETGLPYVLSLKDLSTIGTTDFGELRIPVTGHPKIDPDNGDLLFYGVFGDKITWLRADKTATRLIEKHTFDQGVPALHHDFTVTKDYAIWFILPLIMNMKSMISGGKVFSWNPELGVKIAVMSRKDFTVKIIPLEGAWAITHFLNAHQEGDDLIINANRAEATVFFVSEESGNEPNNDLRSGPYGKAKSYPWRWVVDTVNWKLKEQTKISNVNSELPRHNESLVGKKNRYGYYAASRGEEFAARSFFDTVLKLDLETNVAELQNVPEELANSSEPVFVPRPGATEEDDGWVMTMYWNEKDDASELVIGDGKDFTGNLVARVKIGRRLPLGFHGSWAQGFRNN